jgi:hypothetical protein
LKRQSSSMQESADRQQASKTYCASRMKEQDAAYRQDQVSRASNCLNHAAAGIPGCSTYMT